MFSLAASVPRVCVSLLKTFLSSTRRHHFLKNYEHPQKFRYRALQKTCPPWERQTQKNAAPASPHVCLTQVVPLAFNTTRSLSFGLIQRGTPLKFSEQVNKKLQTDNYTGKHARSGLSGTYIHRGRIAHTQQNVRNMVFFILASHIVL